jgi:dihydrofolate reductase
MLSLIVAKAKNNIIGKNNALIWHLPDDLKRFKNLTTGHTIIMGRRTFESLGRVLPNRHHVILCNDMEMSVDNENVEILKDISELKEYMENDEENFIIGGATIYRILMPYCQKMYITEIDKDFEGDVSFPEIDKQVWKETSREQGPEDGENDFKYDYVIYEKI